MKDHSVNNSKIIITQFFPFVYKDCTIFKLYYKNLKKLVKSPLKNTF